MATRQKQNGIHYTPPELVDFLARRILDHWSPTEDSLVVLDPACGDGRLLRGIAEAMPPAARKGLTLVGFETDADAASECRETLSTLPVREVDVREQDFLSVPTRGEPTALPLFRECTPNPLAADVVISNPPYVRTQVLGSARSQELAARFGLSGRIDLAHAFIVSMVYALKPGGVLGLLTSNRFLVTKAGRSVRRFLRKHVELCEIIDLGDTKLFDAAVLPAILIGIKQSSGGSSPTCEFVRIYESDDGCPQQESSKSRTVLQALDQGLDGVTKTDQGYFRIQRGKLAAEHGASQPWFSVTPSVRKWLDTVRANTHWSFGDVAEVKVGIKTTADAVFIRDDWRELPKHERPEDELLRPIVTRAVASRWRATKRTSDICTRVLYTHRMVGSRRAPIPLEEYPRAKAYLESHRERLASRQYLANSGRQWFEIWVPQDPTKWPRPKVVWPDICAAPAFFLEDEGAVVNGDCYWLSLRDRFPNDVLLLLLGIANSAFIEQYYDAVFCNQLYSGRRRYMTQYVKEFPVPAPDAPSSQAVVDSVRKLLQADVPDERKELEASVDASVQESFGLSEELVR